ncbi:unnamed protein product [Clavelina lepadiformis]|uniref:Translation factor GUF1 homolog, mitochondrial n=1 Tax=Clavelina lepadiformis TaxID=159417 RepID=A0ABP0F7F2_CLALP
MRGVTVCAACKRLLKTNISIARRHCRLLSTTSNAKKDPIDLTEFPPEQVRNFGIIAHVDHGKSTLADRLLEVTGAISASDKNKQVLDSLQVERERGITVKAQTASIIYRHNNEDYLLNLIDTPGHVDFSYEVSRSLSACQGVLLIVDASQGIQAQTLANFYLTMEHELEVIPVINKIDLKTANVEKVSQEMHKVMGINPDDIIPVSAKKGTNVTSVLQAVVERLPSPNHIDKASYDSSGLLKALLFDSTFEKYRGVIANVLVMEGQLRKGDHITSAWLESKDNKAKKSYEVKDVGVLRPESENTGVLYAGQVGYIVCGMRSTSEAQIGDTLYHPKHPVEPVPGFVKPKPVVFGCMFPIDQTDYRELEAALNRLSLNDRSVLIETARSQALGAGFRIGFLGLLHMDVFRQRLEQEFNASTVMTCPTVPYKAMLKPSKKKSIKEPTEIIVKTPSELPDKVDVLYYSQPMIIATIITPLQFDADVVNLCLERGGTTISNTNISDTRVLLQFRMPMSEVIIDFYDRLKSLTSGYASFDYEEDKYEVVNLVRVDFRLNGDVVSELSNGEWSDS